MTIFYITNCDGLWGCHMMNERLQPEDSKGELIHSLSGSYCIGLTYGAVTWWMNDSNPKTQKVN